MIPTGQGTSIVRVVVRSMLPILLLCLLLLHPALLGAHTVEESLQNGKPETGGLDEHLGARIPLNLTFRDETGKTVRLSELITGPTLIVPVYYHCTNVCNLQQSYVAGALTSLALRPGKDYRVISVSFDEHETPELAAKSKRMYLAAMNSTFPADGWHFLTGDRNAIRSLTDAVGFRFERRGNDFIHPVVSLVVARDGTIVRYLYGVAILPKDLALALSEAEKGMTGPSIRKLVEYCYTYDPVGKTYVFNLLRISAAVVILVAGGFLLFLVFGGRKQSRPPREK